MLRFSKSLFFTIIILLISGQNSIGQPDSKAIDNYVLRPGDLVIRHKGRTLGPIGGVPHIGIYVGDMPDFNVVHLEIEKKDGEKFGIIRVANYLDEKHFEDPGFYSVLDSRIPITVHGQVTSFAALPDEQKNKIRVVVCEIAKEERGRNFGKYYLEQVFSEIKHSQNCGDWVLEVYDRALRQEGITVMSHKIPWKGTHSWNLKAGELRDYAELFFGSTDPSRLSTWLKEVKTSNVSSERKITKKVYYDQRSQSASRTPPLPPGGGGAALGGVDIAVSPENSGKIDPRVKALILKSKPSADILQRPVWEFGKEEE